MCWEVQQKPDAEFEYYCALITGLSFFHCHFWTLFPISRLDWRPHIALPRTRTFGDWGRVLVGLEGGGGVLKCYIGLILSVVMLNYRSGYQDS